MIIVDKFLRKEKSKEAIQTSEFYLEILLKNQNYAHHIQYEVLENLKRVVSSEKFNSLSTSFKNNIEAKIYKQSKISKLELGEKEYQEFLDRQVIYSKLTK